MDGAAPESGGGDPQAKAWDWNSPYWRKLGAPWGGTHASAPDVARFLDEFLGARGRVVKPETARLMVQNHNPAGPAPPGVGGGVGPGGGRAGGRGAPLRPRGVRGPLLGARRGGETVLRRPRAAAAPRGAPPPARPGGGARPRAPPPLTAGAGRPRPAYRSV